MPRLHLLALDLPNAGLVAGDPVSALRNNHGWGKHKTEENYLADHDHLRVVWVNTIPMARAQRWREPHFREAVPGDFMFDEEDVDDADRVVFLGKHRWRFLSLHDDNDTDERNLVRERLHEDRRIVLPRSELNSWVHDRCDDRDDTRKHLQVFDAPPAQWKSARRNAREGLVKPRGRGRG